MRNAPQVDKTPCPGFRISWEWAVFSVVPTPDGTPAYPNELDSDQRRFSVETAKVEN